MNVIVQKLEYAGEIWEGNAKFVKQLETVQMVAAKKILGCSSTTSNTVLRSELGMYPLIINRDVRKLKWQYKEKYMPEKRLPTLIIGQAGVGIARRHSRYDRAQHVPRYGAYGRGTL